MNAAARPGRVLVLEDDPLTRQLIGTILGLHGAEMIEAGDIESARAVFEREVCDVVITDIHLPDGDSIEFIAELHARFPGLPVVYITGDVDRRVASQAISTDPAGFLIKPFELAELQAVLLHALKESAQSTRLDPRPTRGFESDEPLVLLAPENVEEPRGTPWATLMRVAASVAVMLLAAFALGAMLLK